MSLGLTGLVSTGLADLSLRDVFLFSFSLLFSLSLLLLCAKSISSLNSSDSDEKTGVVNTDNNKTEKSLLIFSLIINS